MGIVKILVILGLLLLLVWVVLWAIRLFKKITGGIGGAAAKTVAALK